MKKKFMMVAALVGVLSLSACVDDNESASVEAVRNAKAEQLKSVAAMNNATAEATKLLAEADAALTAAQTEAQKIQNELEEVNVEIAKVKLESDKAALEAQKARLEYQKEQIAADLKILAANLESNLLNAKRALLEAQYQYNNQLEVLSAQEQTRLKNLLTAYTKASTDLIDAKQSLENLNIDLTALENGLVTAKEMAHQDSLKLNKQIAEQEALIAIYKKYSSISYEDAQAAYTRAYNEWLVLNGKELASSQAYTVASNNETNARTALNNSAYYQKIDSKFIGKFYENFSISYLYSNNPPFYGYSYYKDGIWEYLKMFTAKIMTSYHTEWNNADGTYGGNVTNQLVSEYYAINKTDFNAYIALVTKAVKVKKDAVNTAQTTYDNAITEEATAKAAAEASTATQADKDAYITARQDRVAAENSLNAAKATLETAESKLKELTDAYAFVTDETQVATITKLVKNYNEAVKAEQDAYVQYQKDTYTANIKRIEVNVLSNAMNDQFNHSEINITRCENNIEYYKAQLSNMSNISQEQLIAHKKVEITNKEAEVAQLEKEVTKAKAALDAAMK